MKKSDLKNEKKKCVGAICAANILINNDIVFQNISIRHEIDFRSTFSIIKSQIGYRAFYNSRFKLDIYQNMF